ncbi:MAG: hypothetical protein JXD18_04500 [Anaerolineae bacterium]|nr:hypothetical protein [Anaerolineae bacterium]
MQSSRVRAVAVVAGVSVLLLVVTSIPLLFGYLTTPSDRWFSGVVYNVHDTAQYFSWMRESGHAVLIENRLTSEPNEPIYFNLHWWLPGRLAALLGLSLVQIYQLFRCVSIPLGTGVIFAFAARLFPERSHRWFAFLLALFTSGLGWIWVVKKYLLSPHTLDFPRDVYALPGNTFWVMTAAPHLTFALALTLLTLLLSFEGYRRGRWWPFAAGWVALFLGMGHIYDLVTVWGVLAVFGVLVTLRDGWSWRVLWRLGLVVLVSAPAPLYWGWVSSGAHPIWQQALAQYDNLGVHTPDPLHLLVLLGLTFLVAAGTFDGVVPLRSQSDERLLIKSWFGISLLLIYLPLRFQSMLLTGYQWPIAVLTTWGLFERMMPWLRDRLSRTKVPVSRVRVVPAIFLLAVLPTNLYLLSWRLFDLNRHGYPYYLARGDLAAMEWLEANGDPDDVVLSSFSIGHYIPGFTGLRPFLANSVMTMDSHDRAQMLEAFFDDATSDEERAVLLREYRIRYLFYGPAERALGAFDPYHSALFREVYANDSTHILEVLVGE